MFLLVLSCAPIVQSQIGRSTIAGFVFSPERQPVGQIPVELLNDVDQVVQRTRTDGGGRFVFNGLQTGRYRLRVLPLGTSFEEQTVDIEIVQIGRSASTSSSTEHREIYLRSARPSPMTHPTGTVFAQDVPEPARKLFELAQSQFEKDQADAGRQTLIRALEMFPEYFAALERLGFEFMKARNYEYARAVYIKAVSVNDRSFVSWYGLCIAAKELKQYSIATEAAAKAHSLDPSSPDAALILGTVYRLAGRFPESEKALLSAKKLSEGRSADVHWQLALLYGNHLKKYKEAANELESYLKLVPVESRDPNVKKLIETFRQKSSGN